MAEVGNLLRKITDPMAIIIRVVGFDVRMFLIFVRTFRISLFL